MWAVDDQGPEALLARMRASPAQGAVADAAPVIQEEGQLLLPFFVHSWHSGLPSFFAASRGVFGRKRRLCAPFVRRGMVRKG